MGDEIRPTTVFLNHCRERRNQLLCDHVGAVTAEEVAQLMSEVERLRERVLAGLAERHPELVPEGDGG